MHYVSKGRAQTKTPLIADIPEERSVASSVFSKVGVDYFGPITVKIGRTNEKFWCCFFTCFTVRALHREIVQKLETDNCLNAFLMQQI